MTSSAFPLRAKIARRDFMKVSGTVAAVVAAGACKSVMTSTRPTTQEDAMVDQKSEASPSTIVLERVEGSILLIGIDRPAAKNFIDPPTFVGLGEAYYQLDHDDELRVGLLHARGPDFVPGLDIAAYGALANSGQFPPTTKREHYIDPLDMTQPRRSKPLVVAVQGATKYVGHELFLAADVRVAASDTIFSQGEATLGLFPAGGATVRFVREAGRSNAMYHMLTGEPWGADEAYRLGLVHAVTPPGKTLARALEIARKISAAAPLGVRATLASVRRAEAEGDEASFAAARPELGRLFRTEDFQEFVRARKDGRVPRYRGR